MGPDRMEQAIVSVYSRQPVLPTDWELHLSKFGIVTPT